MKKLGVIGGLGPMATAYFMQLLVSMTDAASDQEHMETLIYSRPTTPDRTRYILGLESVSPGPVMADSAKKLVSIGAEVLAVPCNTAHYFHKEIQDAAGVPVVHMLRDTASYLKARGIKTAGIMATDGTIQTGLYQKELSALGIDAVTPSKEGQEKVMHLIYKNVKAGRKPEMELFYDVTGELSSMGAQAFVLACTELSVIKGSYDVGSGVLDALEVLARSCILSCGAPLRAQYEELITP